MPPIRAERYSAVDTIREQGNVYLGCRHGCLSTAGNVLAQIVADTVGRHDTIGGACATESTTVRYALGQTKPCMPAATAICWPWPSTTISA